MTIQTYTIPDHIKGDTWPGVSFTVIVNGEPLPLTGASIRMMLRNTSNAIKKTFTSEVDGGITITDGEDGDFQIDEQIIDIPAGRYKYDIEFTLANGDVKTYIKGTWTITQDITYG
jgi:hypothetical protein